MKFERVMPGEYRAQLHSGDYVWVVKEGRRWAWYVGGYSGYDHIIHWEVGHHYVFKTRKAAIADAVAKLLN